MPIPVFNTFRRSACAAALAGLSACTLPGSNDVTSEGIFDPYEPENRQVHAFNKALDTNIVRPVAVAYDAVVPDGIERNILNFSDNLSVPGAIINQVMQLDMNGATRNSVRFIINSTLGFGGLADVASDMGLPEDDADFGQTLAVWGFPEGAFLEIHALGPMTERDGVGKIVDYALNPLRGLGAKESDIATGAGVAAGLTARSKFSSTIDSVLYESTDSYAASRDIYLQNRRFELEQAGVAKEDESDPYADIFGE
ncbi:MAG: VacJ family lipoprotein [Marinovum sp.]|nr:VacJ family lipoprotein [Marinovum sp.]